MFSDLKIVTGSSNPELAKAICDHLGCQLTPTLATTFSDGELRIEIGDNVRGDDVFVVQPTCPPLVNRNLMQLCLMLDEERIYIIQERCAGRIAMAPSGAAGFGYDPVFIIDEAGMTAADLPAEDKDRYSHRGKAARRMGALLERELEGIRRNQQ